MKTRILTLALLALVLFTSSCEKGVFCTKGEGAIVEQALELPPITGIDMCLAGDVALTQGEAQSIVVHGQQNIIDKLKFDVKNGVWTIDVDGCVNYKDNLRFEITLPTLTDAHVTGSGDIWTTNHFTELTNVATSISGSGDMDLSFDANTVDTDITGSGNYDLTGTCATHDFKLSGSGNLDAYEFTTSTSAIKISGSGDAEISATDQLDARISGSGTISYKGNPTIDVDISGSGDLINAN
ncbi:MAG: head GIN domain-containing protein [Bacteroidota bacterium]